VLQSNIRKYNVVLKSVNIYTRKSKIACNVMLTYVKRELSMYMHACILAYMCKSISKLTSLCT